MTHDARRDDDDPRGRGRARVATSRGPRGTRTGPRRTGPTSSIASRGDQHRAAAGASRPGTEAATAAAALDRSRCCGRGGRGAAERCPRVPDPVGRSAKRIWLQAAATPGRVAALTSGARNPRLDDHVVVQQQHGVCAPLERGGDARVDAAREAGVAAQPDHDGLGKAASTASALPSVEPLSTTITLERLRRRPRRARRGSATCRPCRSRRGDDRDGARGSADGGSPASAP